MIDHKKRNHILFLNMYFIFTLHANINKRIAIFKDAFCNWFFKFWLEYIITIS